ncbi:MAG: hypothetical protein WD578_03510 [Bacteroidales bacterium]
MNKVLRNIFKWLLRIVLGLVSLVVLFVLLFYLFRGKITEKTVDYVNELQPGVVSIEKLNLSPFMKFRDISLQLKGFQYSTGLSGTGLYDSVPVLRMENLFVSLDIVSLIKGQYKISRVSIRTGEINYMVGTDSISNIEKALGIRFGESPSSDTLKEDSSSLILDLEQLQLRDLTVKYRDLPGKSNFDLKINGLESGFSYYPDTITASLMSHMEISNVLFGKMAFDRPKTVSFSTALNYDQLNQVVSLDNSMLDLNYAIMELSGKLNLRDDFMALDFSARNSGIELLNFLLNGVLDMNAIEQIGEGRIRFDGKIMGAFKDSIPQVKVNFVAEDMGFRIHSIDQSITQIRFKGSATNGAKKDFSEAEVRLNDFHVTFPKGGVDADIHVTNLVTPKVQLAIKGDADLSVINEIISSEKMQHLKGTLQFSGELDGIIDKASGNFLDHAGALRIMMNDVQFLLPGHKVEQLAGELYLEKEILGLRDTRIVIDSNEIFLEGEVIDILPYFMGFEADPVANIRIATNELQLNQFTGDTSFTEPFRNMGFRLKGQFAEKNFEEALRQNKIPAIHLDVQDFHAGIPGYTDVSRLNFLVYLDEERVTISEMNGFIGKSYIRMEAELKNYNGFIKKDSSANIRFSIDLGSEELMVGELLTFNNKFRFIPQNWIGEKINQFRFAGSIESTIGNLLNDSILPNFDFLCNEFNMEFSDFPLSLNFSDIDIRHIDSLLIINRLKGSLGQSNLDLRASLANILDSTRTISGNLDIRSELLEVDEILNYPFVGISSAKRDTVKIKENQGESKSGRMLELPDVTMNLDVKRLRYAGNNLQNLNGRIVLKPYKVIYFDDFVVQTETGGSVALDGYFNVSDPEQYVLGANLDIDTVSVNDFNLQFALADTIYSLEDNFNGILSANGIAEFFINPDFSIDLENSTAMFNAGLTTGRVKNFTPLHALARFTGNKDLDNVKFGEMNGYNFMIQDGRVQVPLMNIQSTLGLILIEGEQGFQGDFLYLLRVPPRLAGGTAWNILSNQQRKQQEEEGEIQQMQAQKFVVMTVYGKGDVLEVKLRDQRDKYR